MSGNTEPRILLRTQRVLDVRINTLFARLDEDKGRWDTYVGITEADWIALGRPEAITVTIEPGDKLNEPCGLIRSDGEPCPKPAAHAGYCREDYRRETP